jgi:hypothetical protein
VKEPIGILLAIIGLIGAATCVLIFAFKLSTLLGVALLFLLLTAIGYRLADM